MNLVPWAVCAFSGVCPCVRPPWRGPVAPGSTFFSRYPSNRRVVHALQTPLDVELHHHEEPRSHWTANDSGDAAPEVAGWSTEFHKEVWTQEQNTASEYAVSSIQVISLNSWALYYFQLRINTHAVRLYLLRQHSVGGIDLK